MSCAPRRAQRGERDGSRRTHVFNAAMPFGGYKESGWGREMGHAVLNDCLETKSVVTAL